MYFHDKDDDSPIKHGYFPVAALNNQRANRDKRVFIIYSFMATHADINVDTINNLTWVCYGVFENP